MKLNATKSARGGVNLFFKIVLLFVAIALGVGVSYAYFTARASDTKDIVFANVAIDFVDSNEVYTTSLFNTQQLSTKIQPGDSVAIKNVYVKNTGEYDVYAIYKLTLKITKQNLDTEEHVYYYNLSGTQLTGSSSSTTDEATFLAINAIIQTNLTVQIPYEFDNSYKQATANFNLECLAIQSLLDEDNGLQDKITACQLILKNQDQPTVSSLKVYLDGKLKSALMPSSNLVKDVSVDGITNENSPGWFYDAECTEFAYDDDKITADTILYTKTATPDKYNVASGPSNTAVVTTSYDVAEGDVVVARKCIIDGNAYTITNIGKDAFHNGSGNNWKSNEKMTSIVLPQTINTISESAFYGCIKIKKLGLSKNIYSIGYMAFKACSELDNVIVPPLINYIAGDLFCGCSALTNITLNDNISYFAAYAFYKCTSLTKINLPLKLSRILDYAFFQCEKLTSIELPSTVVVIGQQVFKGCGKLTKIVIPSSVTNIGKDCFSECSSLSIYCEASSKPTGWNDTWNSSNRPVTWGYTGSVSSVTTNYAILPQKRTAI